MILFPVLDTLKSPKGISGTNLLIIGLVPLRFNAYPKTLVDVVTNLVSPDYFVILRTERTNLLDLKRRPVRLNLRLKNLLLIVLECSRMFENVL